MNNLILILLLSRANLNMSNITPLLFNQMGPSQNNIQSQVMGMLRNRISIPNSPIANIMSGMLGNNMLGNLSNNRNNSNTPMPINRNFFDNVNKTLSGMDPEKKSELLDIAKSVFKN